MSKRKRGAWPQERIDRLNELLAQGLRYAVIGERLGVCKGAICSKVRVMRKAQALAAPVSEAVSGLKAPPVARDPAAGAAISLRGPRKAAPVRVVARLERFEPLAVSRPTPFAALGAHLCKWPIGDVAGHELTCCGAQADDGPYCAPHEDMNRDRAATAWMDRRVASVVRRAAA